MAVRISKNSVGQEAQKVQMAFLRFWMVLFITIFIIEVFPAAPINGKFCAIQPVKLTQNSKYQMNANQLESILFTLIGIFSISFFIII